MGGDGGVIPKNRRYLRGAGAAEKTGNAGTEDAAASVDPAILKQERQRAMRHCAISGKPLIFDNKAGGANQIVVCPYGRFYNKEAIVEALLTRKKTKDTRLAHIRGLKDLHDARFHTISSSSQQEQDGNQLVPACPIRGTELNGQIPAILLVPGNPEAVNVISERAMTDLGEENILAEFGPATSRVKILPTEDELEEIQRQHAALLAKKKDKKKRKRAEEGHENKETTTAKNATIQSANSNHVAASSAKPQSKVLKSLFTPKLVSDKEKVDNLFART